MRLALLLALVSHQAFGAYTFTRKITLDHTRAAGTLSGFPMGFIGTYTYLKTVGNGGNVQSSNGYDIAFSTDALNASPIACEQDVWSATTGVVVYWVNVPSVSSTVDTVIYIHYGDSGISTPQCTASAVWDSNYKAVYHFGNSSTLSLADSTSNAISLTNFNTATAAAGVAGGGVGFGGANALYSTTLPMNVTNNYTLEAWISTTTSGSFPTSLQVGTTSNGYRLLGEAANFQCGNMNGVGGSCVNGAGQSGWTHLSTTTVSTTSNTYLGTASGGWNTPGSATPGTPITPTAIFSIGAAGTSAAPAFTDWLSGFTVDEVRISNVARTAAWIQTEYNNIGDPSHFYTVGPAGSGSMNVFPILY